MVEQNEIIIYDNLATGITMFDIDYYQDSSGKKPVMAFIDSLDVKLRVKVMGILELLETYGACLGMPYTRHLVDGIYEIRASMQGNTVRILYFFAKDKRIVLTHGFVKKTQKTPKRELERAQKIRADWRSKSE